MDTKASHPGEVTESDLDTKTDPSIPTNAGESAQSTIEVEKEKPVDLTHKETREPLFLRHSSDGRKGNAQDEKDATEE